MQKITPFLWFNDNAEEAMKAKRVMEAMLKMRKIDLKTLQEAYQRG